MSIKHVEKERGAALVEMAIIAPLLVLLVFGILEFGLAFKNKLTIAHSANAAARIGSTIGTDPEADMLILEAVEAGFNGLVNPTIVNYVDIYQSDDAGNKLAYNRYFWDGASACNWNPCPDPAGTPVYGNPSGWGDPGNRDVVLDSDGLDTLGVEVQYTHNWVTSALGFSPQNWSEHARVRLEPDVFGTTP